MFDPHIKPTEFLW